jgi:endonuclease YncB( thermonuclease family)
MTIAAMAAGVIVMALEQLDPSALTSPAASVMPPRTIEAHTPVASTQAAEPLPSATPPTTQEPATKLQDSIPVAAEAEPSYDDVELEPPFMILDGQSFSAGKWAISVRDVLGPHRDAICLDRKDELFACGLQARAALNNLLRAGKVACHVRLPPIHGRFESVCTVGKADLAEALVSGGWVRPTGQDERLDAAMRKARDAQAGLWNGGWRIRQQP